MVVPLQPYFFLGNNLIGLWFPSATLAHWVDEQVLLTRVLHMRPDIVRFVQ